MSIRSKQKGIGLLELMLSLAVAAVLLMIIGRYYFSVSFARDANAAHVEIIEISQALYQYKNLNGSWQGVTLNALRPWLNREFVNNIDKDGKAPAPFARTFYQVVPQVNSTTGQEAVSIQIAGFDADPKDLNSDCARLAKRINDTVCDGKALKYCYPPSASCT